MASSSGYLNEEEAAVWYHAFEAQQQTQPQLPLMITEDWMRKRMLFYTRFIDHIEVIVVGLITPPPGTQGSWVLVMWCNPEGELFTTQTLFWENLLRSNPHLADDPALESEMLQDGVTWDCQAAPGGKQKLIAKLTNGGVMSYLVDLKTLAWVLHSK